MSRPSSESHSPVSPPSSTTTDDKSTDVNRREFIQHTAIGGAILATWADTQMTHAQDKESDRPGQSQAVAVKLRLNGQNHELRLDPRMTLLDAIRHQLHLTGTKKGCDHGQCGSCTVLVNGKRINSCLTLAVMQDGAEITTIEGLEHDQKLHPLQQAFVEHDAFQCGYCTPGQICSAAGLLTEGRAKTTAEIRELMSGNICRCGAYPNIVAAIHEVLQSAHAGGRE